MNLNKIIDTLVRIQKESRANQYAEVNQLRIFFESTVLLDELKKLKNIGEARSDEGAEQNHLFSVLVDVRDDLKVYMPFQDRGHDTLIDLLDDNYVKLESIIQKHTIEMVL